MHQEPLSTETLRSYLAGALSDEERYALEYRLLDDEKAQAALEGMAKANLSDEEWQEDLRDIQNRWRDQPSTRMEGSPLWRWTAVAASIVLLVALGWNYGQHQQEQNLFADHFTPVPEEGIRIRGAGEVTAPSGPAYDWYQAGQYEKSLAAFQARLNEVPEDGQARLYAGIAALQLEETPLARQYFTELIAADQHVESAHWYLALVFLQEADENAALDQLEWLLINAEGPYRKKAQALMDALAPGEE